MKRRFSCREISLIDQMIQTIGRDLFLPERLGDDARSIGWCTFLHTYQKYPAQFLWAGVGGWARAYLDIDRYEHGRTTRCRSQDRKCRRQHDDKGGA